MFWAMTEEHITPIPQTIVFDWATGGLSPGLHYDNTTGFFTAPVDDLCEFNVQLRSTDDVSSGFILFVNGDDKTYTQGANNVNGALFCASSTATLDLVASWAVSVREAGIGSLDGFPAPQGPGFLEN